MLAGVAGVEREDSLRFREACELVQDIIAREGNVEYLKAEARTGIRSATSVDSKDDPEDFEDPAPNFVPPQLRRHMPQYTPEELASFKSRGEDGMPALGSNDPAHWGKSIGLQDIPGYVAE
jgi:hypothetical protein